MCVALHFRTVGADDDGDMPTCMLVIRRLPDQRVLGSEEPCRASRLQNIACKEGTLIYGRDGSTRSFYRNYCEGTQVRSDPSE